MASRSRDVVSSRRECCGGAGLALYSGEIERHWIDVTPLDIYLLSLPPEFEGLNIVQLSDIHLDEFTEPFLLREAVARINRLQPEVVLLTGDYVSYEIAPRNFRLRSAWQCAEIRTNSSACSVTPFLAITMPCWVRNRLLKR